MSGFADCNVDPAILSRARRGDMKAHEVLYRAYGTPVYTLASRMLQNRSLADEVLQETSIEVIRKLGTMRDPAAFSGWVKRIAVNKCLAHLRSAWHRLVVQPGTNDGESPVDWPQGSDAGEHTGRVQGAMDLAQALKLLAARRTIGRLAARRGRLHPWRDRRLSWGRRPVFRSPSCRGPIFRLRNLLGDQGGDEIMHATTKQLLEIRDGEAVARDVTVRMSISATSARVSWRGWPASAMQLRGLAGQIEPAQGPVAGSRGRIAWADRRPPSVLVGIGGGYCRLIRCCPGAGDALFARARGRGLRPATVSEQVAGESNAEQDLCRRRPRRRSRKSSRRRKLASSDELRNRSRRLESLRRAMPQQPAGRAGQHDPDHCRSGGPDRARRYAPQCRSAVGLGLTPQQEKALWRERVNLMNTLVRLEYSQISSPRY